MEHASDTALEQECSERQQDELIALEAIYPDEFIREESVDGGIDFNIEIRGAVLHVSLPKLYPYKPPNIGLSCPGCAKGIVNDALVELTSTIPCDGDGDECCLQLVQSFFDLVTDKFTPAPPVPPDELDTDSDQAPSLDVSGLVKNSHSDKYKVYIGRPDKGTKPKSGDAKWGWGNPFPMGKTTGRGTVIRKYADWIMDPERAALREEARKVLKGKTLGCFCKPLPCHGDVLAVIANSEDDDELRQLGLEWC